MPTNTLTSLAILRVHVDRNSDYLSYLEPFVLQILADSNTNVVTNDTITHSIRQRFGLAIPERTVEIVLRRFTKRKILTREHNELRVSGSIPDPQLVSKQAEAERHIHSVINGVRRFSQESVNPLEDEDQAVEAICAFLSEFDVSCLRSYLRGTALPEVSEASTTDKILVSNYVQSIHQSEPERFRSFLILVQGHMLANALVCPDLENAPQSFSGLTFYLDTPLLVRRLGLEGPAKQHAATELTALIKNLGGKVATFSHSGEELHNVIQGAAAYLDSPYGHSAIIQEARQVGTTRSDLIIFAETVPEGLANARIEVEPTPGYTERIQIDEAAFEQVLVDEVGYFNPRAKEFDINSVRSIYVKRAKKQIPSLEKSHAVLVTSNSAFAKAAWQYGQKYTPSQAVSAVITDFTLANLAWLKAPMGGLEVPRTQLMAISYAALQPSRELLGKYMSEIERLENEGAISERDHQLLRSSPMVSKELMNLTLGSDELLTEETVTEILERVTDEIKKEETDRAEQLERDGLTTQKALAEETDRAKQLERDRLTTQKALAEETDRAKQLERDRLTTQKALEDQIEQNNKIRSSLFWQCQKQAKILARAISLAVAVLLIFIIVVSSLDFAGLPQGLKWPIIGVLAMLTAANLLCGLTVKGTYHWIEETLQNKLVKSHATALGLDPRDIGTN